MFQQANLTQGDTFSLAGTALLGAGTWSATSQVVDGQGNLIATNEVTLTDPVSPSNLYTILLTSPATSTVNWPKGQLFSNVRFADTSTPPVIKSSPTFTIYVSVSPTNEP